MTLDEISKGIIEALDNTLASDKAVDALSRKITDGKGTYADAESLASKTGLRTGKAISDGLIQNAVDGMVTEDVARAAIIEPLKHNHSIVSGACRFVQEALNREAGLGLKAIQPKFNQDRADGLVTEAVGREDMSDFAKALTQQVENFSMATVDDSVKENADAHYEAGLYPKIRRITDGKCCEWCSSLAGTYEYGEVRNTGNDVFRRHPNCGCQVLYDPGEGSREWQNVHTKKDLTEEESNVDRVIARIKAAREKRQWWRMPTGKQKRDEWELIRVQDIHETREIYSLDEKNITPEQRIAAAERIERKLEERKTPKQMIIDTETKANEIVMASQSGSTRVGRSGNSNGEITTTAVKNNTESTRGFRPVDEDRVVNVMRKEYDPWHNSLSDSEKRAINKYADNGEEKRPKFYERLNEYLRLKIAGIKLPERLAKEASSLDRYARIISNALKRQPLQNDIICYRTVTVNPFIGLKPGTKLRPGQFFSTSVVKGGAFKNGEYRITIFAPKGTKGAYIERLSPRHKQREFLIDKDCQYVIKSIKGNEIVLEVVV